MGSSAYHLCMTLNTKNNSLSAGLYVHEDKEIIAKFKANEELVAKILGISDQNEIEWRLNDNKKSSRFLVPSFYGRYEMTKIIGIEAVHGFVTCA